MSDADATTLPAHTAPRTGVWVAGALSTLAVIVLLVALEPTVWRIPNPALLLVIPLVVAAFLGGTGPALVSAALGLAYLLRFFSSPGEALSFTHENLMKVGVQLLVFPAVALLVGRLKARSERMRNEALERQADARTAALLRTSLDAIVTLDLEGRVLDFNPSAERMFGRPRPSVVGRDFAELCLPEADRAGVRAGLRRYVETGEHPLIGRLVELTGVRADRTEFPVEISLLRRPGSGPPAFTGFLRDITARRRAEQALRQSEEHLRALVSNAPMVLFALDTDGRFVLSEGRGLEALGLRPGEVVGRTVFEVYADYPEILQVARRALAGEPVHFQARVGEVVFEVWYRPTRGSRGELTGTIGVAMDVTERARAEQALRASEEQLRQSQKMDAIGRLAGGVAHDFNNLLTAILGYGQLLVEELTPGDPLHQGAREIVHAAERGADLTAQLLAFSRKQVLDVRTLDLNTVVGDMLPLVRRVIGENIRLSSRTGAERALVRADEGQMHQVLMNLVVNARDAMPEGGALEIETGEAAYPASGRTPPGVSPGRYVTLAVRDTGHGMDEATQSLVFEPFFTTKERGKGTGLGLATVYGIVRQCGGTVQVESAPGEGTSFRVLMPSDESGEPAAPAAEHRGPPRGTERVLLVEDDEIVRRLARSALERLGYRVAEAANGAQALDEWGRMGGQVDLLVTDVIMPGVSGPQLARELQRRRPGLRVLYVSGYADDTLARLGGSEEGVAFMQKPFPMESLARRVREVLDA